MVLLSTTPGTVSAMLVMSPPALGNCATSVLVKGVLMLDSVLTTGGKRRYLDGLCGRAHFEREIGGDELTDRDVHARSAVRKPLSATLTTKRPGFNKVKR